MNPRSYMNPITRQWVFLEYNTNYGRWFPHNATMRSWAHGTTRVYRPADNPATLITMPDKQHWPAMSPSEYLYISTSDVPESWIANNQIISSLDEYEIDIHDCMAFEPPPPPNVTSGTVFSRDAPQLTPLTMLAGVLLSLGPAQPHGPPPLILSVLERVADEPTGTSGFPPTAGRLSDVSLSALPPHVSAIMIQHAVNTGATCPITMEPLTAKNAAVTSCGHIFDRDALVRWSADHGTCPECRSTIPTL